MCIFSVIASIIMMLKVLLLFFPLFPSSLSGPGETGWEMPTSRSSLS